MKHSFHREFGGNMKKELIEEYEDYTVWEVSEVVLLNPDGSYVPSYFGDIQIFEKQTNENRTSIFLRYYYKQPKLKYVNEDIHIIGVDVSTSDDYSSVSVICRSCKSILHSTIYQPGMTCFSIPYYTKCPKCGVKISKHIYKENI